MQYMNAHSNEDGAAEALQFFNANPTALDEMAIQYKAIENYYK